MISLVDCVALSGLSEEEIRAIAEHEHVSEAVACGLAQYLSQAKSGEGRMRDMIIDDIRSARARGDDDHVHSAFVRADRIADHLPHVGGDVVR